MPVFCCRAVTRIALFGVIVVAIAMVVVFTDGSSVRAQGLDCNRLQAQIAQAGQGGGSTYAKAARRQSIELERTQAYAHQLGCDRGGFSFFGGSDNPQCPGINVRIRQMQANLGQLQAGGGGGGRDELVARYNAYCRGAQQAPRARGFFESIFGGPVEPQPLPPTELPPDENVEEAGPRGGSQAVCVRSCDGGFFPLAMSARHNGDSLNEMCSALCPGAEAAVYTRSPNADIKTAVGLDGKPYMDMPNALKFQKDYTPACSCHPAGKTWAEALANAEEILGSQRKGDILVTQEKSDELSRPKLDTKTRASLLQSPGTTKVTPATAGRLAADSQSSSKIEEVTGPDGVKRLVRRVGPQP